MELTMIWNDCDCDGMRDFNRHTMKVTEPSKVPRHVLVSLFIHDFYRLTHSSLHNHALAKEAIRKDLCLAGIFIGTPEEL